MRQLVLASEPYYRTLIAQLEVVGRDPSGWVTFYHEPATGDTWRSGFLDSERQGGGAEFVMRLPAPTTNELIQIAINCEYEDEAYLAASLLKDDPESLEALMDQLERHSDGASLRLRERIGKIVLWASLEAETNRREILGKTPEEIDADYQHFARIANRARMLRGKAERTLGRKLDRWVK